MALFISLNALSCAVFATRPVQDMSDTSAALKAAREAQADTLSPELYRNANEWWLRARNEYRYKNFHLASEFANKAKSFAEQAEFDSIRQGAVRQDISEPAPVDDTTPPPPYEYPTPTGTPAESYEQRHNEELQQQQKNAQPSTPAPRPT